MAYIRYVPPEEGSKKLQDLYRRYQEPWGGVDNIIRIHSQNPRAMEAHYELYAHAMRGRSPLTRVQREMIAVVVSALNQCHY
jgi:alkylhydroperoxidase family enzyme